MKTIVYVGGFALPDENAAAHRVVNNGYILKELGYKVVFIGVDKKLDYKKDTYIQVENDDFDMYSIPYPKSSKNWINYLISIKKVKEILNTIDNIHTVICYNYQAIALKKMMKLSKKTSFNIYCDITEWYGNLEGSFLFKLLKKYDTRYRMKKLNHKVDGLILVSDYLNNYYINHSNKCVIPTLTKNNTNIEINSNDKVRFIFAGVPFKIGQVLRNRKNAKDRLDIFIEYLYKINNKDLEYEFNIFGITKEEYLNSLNDDKDKVHTLGDKIIFRGRVPSSEVEKQLQVSDFSVAIRDESLVTKAGFPTKFTESLNNNVPSIVTDTSDLFKYLDEGHNGFILNTNKEEQSLNMLLYIIKMSVDDRKEMKKYIKNKDIFNIKNFEMQMTKLFRKVI